MMNSLKNSSELLEGARLISDLLVNIPESLPYEVFHDVCPPDFYQNLIADTSLFEEPVAPPAEVARGAVTQTDLPHPPAGAKDIGDSDYVGDKLENLLSSLCQQSRFQSAVVADEQGLPIGGYNTPVVVDELAAFSSVLGSVIDKVPYFFEQYAAGNVSVDINYTDKAVVRKFLIGEVAFFLLIICSQDIDERAYIELFSDQISSLLER